MDYQTFNGQQQPPFGGTSSAHAPQPTLPPQAQFQQPGPSFGYGGPPPQFAGSSPGFAGGGVDMMQQPMQPGAGGMQRAAMQHAYSTAPFSQALPSPAHQHFAQNRQTASPAANSGSPYATPHMPQPQQQPQQLHHQSPAALPPNGHQQPMAHIKAEPAQAQTPVKAVPPSPVSPVAQARTQDRLATLLEINSLLIKEVCDLQTQGKAGQVGPAAEAKPEADKPQQSKEYLDCMRRLQANLAYLAQNAESNKKPGQTLQPGPAIMSVPAAPAELAKLYQKLVDLFPGWKGQTTQMKQSPGSQRMNSAAPASTASQPPHSAGLQTNWSQNAMANMQQAQLQAKIEQ